MELLMEPLKDLLGISEPLEQVSDRHSRRPQSPPNLSGLMVKNLQKTRNQFNVYPLIHKPTGLSDASWS